jgi:hypothetical protein
MAAGSSGQRNRTGVTGGPWASVVATLGTARRLTADEAGVIVDPILGRRFTMHWTDVRLLEVTKDRTHSQSDKAIRFMLYGTLRTFRWRDRIGPNYTATQSQQLLDVIATKTGLVPRTGAETLKSLGRFHYLPYLTSPLPSRDMPAQPSQQGLQRRCRDAEYILVWGNHSPRARFVATVIGALLTAADVFTVLWILAALGVHQLDGLLAEVPWFNGIWAFFVLLFGIVGVPLLIGALRRERPSWLLADSSGLHQRSFGRTTSISWASVTDVSLMAGRRGRGIYVVADVASPMYFGWPASTRPWDGPSPIPDSVPLTPEEMAVLVVERIGKER